MNLLIRLNNEIDRHIFIGLNCDSQSFDLEGIILSFLMSHIKGTMTSSFHLWAILWAPYQNTRSSVEIFQTYI